MAAKKKTTKKKATPKRRKAEQPKLGTTITRSFKGKKITVKVTADGFVSGGKTYRSLTAVAKAITKYPSISGPAFFGLDKKSKEEGT